MRLVIFAYCLGIVVVSRLPGLSPQLALVLAAFCLCGFLLAFLFRSTFSFALVVAFAIGMLWHWSWATVRLNAVLPTHLEGVDFIVSGEVVGLPVNSPIGQRFQFKVRNDSGELAGGKLLLGSYDSIAVAPGQYWQLQVRLKQPHGNANPGSFDREADLLRMGIVATGYVRDSSVNRLLGASRFSFYRLRYNVIAKLNRALERAVADTGLQALMLALLTGERSQLDREQWALFSATGTNHLFVISGLHIGLVSLLCFKLGSLLLRIGPAQMLQMPAQALAAWIAIVAAVAYSALAGLTLPTQRACIMLIVFMATAILSRRVSIALRFLIALAVVLSLDPLATTSAGFWLSFLAVAVLLFFTSEQNTNPELSSFNGFFTRGWARFLAPQWSIFLALLLPLTVWMGQVSLIAPLVNMIAIPMLGLVLLPLLLAGVLLLTLDSVFADTVFYLAGSVLSFLLRFLQFVQTGFAPLSTLQLPVPTLAEILYAIAGILLLLLPRGFHGRFLALPLCLPLVISAHSGVEKPDLRIDVLDVGQGLAVLLRTKNHTLLFDTGPGSVDSWDAGRSIVVPALRHLGVSKLNKIIVSHGDDDHAGGLLSVLEAYPSAAVGAGELLGEIEISRCQANMRWYWDDVEFWVLHPVEPDRLTANDSSCVLLVRAGKHGVLLPGDISAAIEKSLASNWKEALRSSILIAAHHGSASSSSYPLLKMTQPQHVVFATGYRNGFNHPADAVVVRASQYASSLHNTAHTGMLSFALDGEGESVGVANYRDYWRRYWHWSGI